jgi:hypothetical protein
MHLNFFFNKKGFAYNHSFVLVIPSQHRNQTRFGSLYAEEIDK